MFRFSIESTDSPAHIVFKANNDLVIQPISCVNIDQAKDYPLIQQLFYLPFVKSVSIRQNRITVERFDIVQWGDVQNEVKEQLESFLNEGGLIQKTTVQQTAVTVYAESTPNPAVMKFVVNKPLTQTAAEFKNIDDAKDAPLAVALFHFAFVKEIYLNENFVSVTKYEVSTWEEIAVELREFVREYVASGKEIMRAVTTKNPPQTEQIEYTGIDAEIISILDQYVKPAVASDGGNILFESYNENEKSVQVILQGACSGCPSSTFTLKNGIETMLKEMLPGKVNQVIAING